MAYDVIGELILVCHSTHTMLADRAIRIDSFSWREEQLICVAIISRIINFVVFHDGTIFSRYKFTYTTHSPLSIQSCQWRHTIICSRETPSLTSQSKITSSQARRSRHLSEDSLFASWQYSRPLTNTILTRQLVTCPRGVTIVDRLRPAGLMSETARE